MLKAFRQKKNIKRIMFFTAILIIPAFVFWGVGSVFSSRSKNALATDQVFVAIAITTGISIGLFLLITFIERAMLPWYYAARRAEQWEQAGIY